MPCARRGDRLGTCVDLVRGKRLAHELAALAVEWLGVLAACSSAGLGVLAAAERGPLALALAALAITGAGLGSVIAAEGRAERARGADTPRRGTPRAGGSQDPGPAS